MGIPHGSSWTIQGKARKQERGWKSERREIVDGVRSPSARRVEWNGMERNEGMGWNGEINSLAQAGARRGGGAAGWGRGEGIVLVITGIGIELGSIYFALRCGIALWKKGRWMPGYRTHETAAESGGGRMDGLEAGTRALLRAQRDAHSSLRRRPCATLHCNAMQRTNERTNENFRAAAVK